MHRYMFSSTISLLALGAGLAGCEHHHHRDRNDVAIGVESPQAVTYDVYAPAPPPAPIDEVQPVQPDTDAVWIAGAWTYRDNGWRWEQGRWDHRPRPDAQYRPAHWSQTDRGWARQRGEWR